MKIEYVKSIAAFVLLSLTLFFSTLPLWILPRILHGQNDVRLIRRYRRIISLVSCFGGGVFLGTCLLHLFPEVDKQMIEVFRLMAVQVEFPVAEFLLTAGFLLILVIEQLVLAFQSEEDLPFLTHAHSHSDGTANPTISTSYGAITDDEDVSLVHEQSIHQDQSSHSRLRSVVLVLALSMHSIFEGLAIGLQSSSENVVRILVAVLIHKSIIAFTLGLNLVNSSLRKITIVQCIAIFTLMSPVGTIIGSLIIDVGSDLSMATTSGILQGIACGTFLYVTFFEILPHELNAREDKILKVLFLLLGFATIALLVLYHPS